MRDYNLKAIREHQEHIRCKQPPGRDEAFQALHARLSRDFRFPSDFIEKVSALFVDAEPCFTSQVPGNLETLNEADLTKLREGLYSRALLADTPHIAHRLYDAVAEILKLVRFPPVGNSRFKGNLKDMQSEGLWNDIVPIIERDRYFFTALRKQVELNEAYKYPPIRNTIIEVMLDTEVPLELSDSMRFSHTHIVGKTGTGKSTLLQQLILHDLKSTNAAIVLIDPHHQLFEQFARLRTRRRKVVITPQTAPPINIFEVRNIHDEFERETVVESVKKTLIGLFATQDMVLTGRQTMVFHNLCELMLALPKPGTLIDLLGFLDDPESVKPHIPRLNPVAQSFFKRFIDKPKELREVMGELSNRFQGILQRGTFRRIFSATKTEFSIREEMDKGSLILIDADMGKLGDTAPILGKLLLGLIMQAARERGTDARPVFVYVDECHHFMDQQAKELLHDARKFQVGCTLAHQDFSEIHNPEILGALSGTAIKFAHPIAEDRFRLSKQMNTTEDFFQNLPQYHFGLSTGRQTVAIQTEPDPLGGLPRLSEQEYQALLTPKVPQSTPPKKDDEEDLNWG